MNRMDKMDRTIPTYWAEACRHLADCDQALAKSIDSYQGEVMQRRGDPFYTLARSIVGQQISVKAADTVWSRLEELLGSVEPETALAVSHDQLRSCGLSQQKSGYLLNIAAFCTRVDWQKLEQQEEQIIREQLIAIKGVGQWTWEMFAIFYLQLSDMLPIADIGLINACKKHYGHQSKEEIIAHAEQWRPYRTVATWYLWRSLDPVAVEY